MKDCRVAAFLLKEHTLGSSPEGRDCRSRLGSFAMTGPAFLSYTGPFMGRGLAMTTIPIAKGINEWRQHKNSCHCEEERRGNLQHFFLRLTGYVILV